MGAFGVLLAAHAVYVRFPIAGWRLAGALTVVAVAGLNHSLWITRRSGRLRAVPLPSGGGISLDAVGGGTPRLAARGGGRFLRVAAAGATLLGSAAVPILLVWLLVYNRAGARWTKLAGFLGGAALPLLPFVPMVLRAARVVRFDLIEYHLLYRQVAWDGATKHDADVLTAWPTIRRRSARNPGGHGPVLRSFPQQLGPGDARTVLPVRLAGAGTEPAHSTAHPTFARYYLLTLPFWPPRRGGPRLHRVAVRPAHAAALAVVW